jgi:histidyl-tRNA synthetase
LGDSETRDAWRAALVAHFEQHRGELSEDSLVRLDKNPMRILDSKDPRDRPIADAAPDIDAYLTSEAGAFFQKVTKGLDAANVNWTRNSRLVRGLDYYRHTAFEFVTDRLGAQGTVLAGGRYDGLIESLGGPATPGVGWAAGVERLAMLLEEREADRIAVAVIPFGEEAEAIALSVLADFRRVGASADMAYKGNLKRRLSKANAQGASLAIMLGDEEVASRTLTVKVLGTGKQLSIGSAEVDALMHAAFLYSTGVTDADVEGDSVLEEMLEEWRQGLWTTETSAE